MIKRVFAVVGLLATFALGAWLASWYYDKTEEEVSRSQSTVLLEKVEKVCKLVTVEGNFSEIYDETNIRKFTVYLPLPSTWSFSKQAILQVTGRVLVGYDMEGIHLNVDSTHRQIIIRNLPQPKILAIDHQVQYKNLDDSFFNSFTPDDYTRLNHSAKEVLRRKAEESGLLQQAQQQGNQMLDVIRFMAESVGWAVLVEDANGLRTPLDSLLLRN
ncbi:MAG: DUF4230 domain-containing protein [Phaeodactylibacter sp.]|nr:DUF4230 domain-containing protein [Phaeodactylibacter sp.]MCB9299487.1 DUF4230 domain-containing protein [Lewinellaceae bacterium]